MSAGNGDAALPIVLSDDKSPTAEKSTPDRRHVVKNCAPEPKKLILCRAAKRHRVDQSTRSFGPEVNYARQVFRHADAADADGQPAIVAEDEGGAVVSLGWHELRRRSFSLACELRRLGLGAGDRVAAYLPNRVEAVIAFLACASIGVIWTICAPDMGAPAIVDRFSQVESKMLIATDGAFYAGKGRDLAGTVRSIGAALPTLEQVVLVRSGHSRGHIGHSLDFADLVSREDDEVRLFEPSWLPFDHPLWILYSSGTTGKPKAIVHDRMCMSILAQTARATGVSAYVGDGENRWCAVHVSDVGAVYRRALEAGLPGRVFHASAEEGISFKDIARAIGTNLGLPVESRPREHFGWFAGFAENDAPTSSEHTQNILNWWPKGRMLLDDLGDPAYFSP